MDTPIVSRKLLRRLPVYLHYMKTLPEEIENISATRIARDLGFGDVLVRKDLAKVSDGGRRKLGYLREMLIRDIESFLDVNTTTCAVLVGAGKLGQALMDYEGFAKSGMHILAGFDANPRLKLTDGGKPIYGMDQLDAFCHCYPVSIGIIAVPADQAQQVCDRLVSSGVKAIWNFAPTHLIVPEDVVIQSENLAISLTSLRMQLKNLERDSA